MDDLLSDFIAETRETLDAIASEIVEWEARPDDRARLDSIFRFVHTVKGSCGFLDLPRLLRLSHAAEDALAEVRSDKRQPDSALVSAVLAIIDRIAELTDAMASGDALPDGEDGVLIAALAPGAAAVSPAPEIEAGPPTTPVPRVARSIRLSVELLDRMMIGVSDMVLARNELARRLRDAGDDAKTDVAFDRLSLCIGEMRDAITRSRMARIEAVFSMLPRMVRDLAGELGKQVQLEIDGGDVELDREMIEMIRDPLTHIVRNSIDHGIEPPDVRRASGKPPRGCLRVTARQSGNQILIEASDDGRGIDEEKLVAKAIASGQISAEQAQGMTRAAKLDLIFAPGVSTANAVTEISGRGVGMDVVRANIEKIGGSVDVDSRFGFGLRLSMRVPLTLTIIPALTVSVGGHRFAVPRSAIDEIVRVNGDTIRIERIGGSAVAYIRGARLPLIGLADFLQLPDTGAAQTLIVARAGGASTCALAVEGVHDHEELVVKPAAPELMGTGLYAGTTLPDNSRPMLLLDIAGIAAANGVCSQPAARVEPDIEAAAETVPALLFRDLDGRETVAPLALAERIEDVDAGLLFDDRGTLRLAQGERVVMVAAGGIPPRTGQLRLLRLDDGAVQLAYAIAEVIDIVRLPQGFDAGGMTLIDGRLVRTLDAHALFAAAAAAAPAAAPPMCLIVDGGDPWARRVLAPLLGNAGYRTAFAGDDGTDAAAIIIIAADEPTPADLAAPVLRLSASPNAGDGSIYRYDRAGLLDAVRSGIGGGR